MAFTSLSPSLGGTSAVPPPWDPQPGPSTPGEAAESRWSRVCGTDSRHFGVSKGEGHSRYLLPIRLQGHLPVPSRGHQSHHSLGTSACNNKNRQITPHWVFPRRGCGRVSRRQSASSCPKPLHRRAQSSFFLLIFASNALHIIKK